MSEAIVQQGTITLDTAGLERLQASERISKTIETLSVFIAPAHIDIGQRAHVQTALQLLVDMILLEAERRAVARLSGGQ